MIELLEKYYDSPGVQNIRPRNEFRAEKFALNLSERSSTATITIGPEAPEIKIGDWLRDQDDPGKGIVWIVSRVDTDYGTNTRTLSCSHIISILRDTILFGEHTTEMVAGKTGATTVMARKAIVYALAKQGDWVIGKWPESYTTVSNAYSYNGDDVFSAIESVTDTLDGCWWDYDLRMYPFRLVLKDYSSGANSGIDSEARMSRNIVSAKISIDRSQMYTRLYPIGKGDLHLPEEYISFNESRYGVICRTQTNAEKETAEDLRAWAMSELKHHCDPVVTASLTALDLSRQTGEALDKITLGTVCRLALPEYGVALLERVNSMSWSDKVKDPQNISVTLANNRVPVKEMTSKVIEKTARATRKSSRVSRTNVSKGVLDVDIRPDNKDKNTYHLWRQDYKGVWKDVGSFKRAVTSWKVSATGGTIKVTAEPQDQSTDVRLRQDAGKWSGLNWKADIQYYNAEKKAWNATGLTVSVNGTTIYNAGWTAAYKKVELPQKPVTNVNSILIKTPPATVGGAAKTTTYIMSNQDNNHVDLQTKVGSEYVTVARYSHGKYNAGWAAAYRKVELPVTEVTNINSILVKTPPATVDGQAASRSYIMSSNGNNHVDLQTLVGSSYVTVARLAHGKYNAGWSAAYNKVSLPKTQSTASNTIVIHTPPQTVDGAYETTSYFMSRDGNHIDLETWDGSAYVTVARLAITVPTASNIDINSWQFSTTVPPQVDEYVDLTQIAKLLKDNQRGYVYFAATLTNGTGIKWYRIATPT